MDTQNGALMATNPSTNWCSRSSLKNKCRHTKIKRLLKKSTPSYKSYNKTKLLLFKTLVWSPKFDNVLQQVVSKPFPTKIWVRFWARQICWKSFQIFSSWKRFTFAFLLKLLYVSVLLCFYYPQHYLFMKGFLTLQILDPQVYLLFLVVDQLFFDFKNIWDTTIKGREVSYDPQIFEFLTC